MDLWYYLTTFSPTIIALALFGITAWGWADPNATGSVDGRWGSPDEEGRYSGLRRVIYNRAYRKHYRKPR